MSTARKSLIVLCLIGIFAAGGATGAFVALRLEHKAAHERAFGSFVVKQLGKMTDELELTPEQRSQVDSILHRCSEDLGTLRRDSITATSGKFREMNKKISALLTPEQSAKFEEMLQRQRERFRKFQAERAERRGDRDGTRPPPPPASGSENPPPPPPGG